MFGIARNLGIFQACRRMRIGSVPILWEFYIRNFKNGILVFEERDPATSFYPSHSWVPRGHWSYLDQIHFR